MIAPCKGCELRTRACHGSCRKYKEYRKALDERIEQRIVANKVNAYVSAQMEKARRGKRKKNKEAGANGKIAGHSNWCQPENEKMEK